MLDTLRKNVRRLSWTLWLVIAAFIILYFPDLVNGGGTGEVVARVNGEEIHAVDFQRALNEQVSYYRNLSQGELPENFIQQMQLHSVVLEQLVRRRLLVAAARDQGFAVAPQEVKDRLMEFPVFRTADGRWVGDAEYQNIVRRNGMDLAGFEQGVVDDLLVDRVTNLISEGVTVSDAEVREAYQRQSEQVSFEFVQIRPSAFEFEVNSEINDGDVRARYENDTNAYRVAEQRRVSYALIDTETLRNALTLDVAELQAEYENSIADYTIEEQVKARQIMLRVPPSASDEAKAEVRARADAVVEQLAGGADFAALAEETSDDPSSAAGGDLGWVTRGRQVEGFDEAVFGLEAGQVSEVFETAFGFNVVLVEEKRAAEVQPFEDVRGQIEQRLAWERAETDADSLSDELRREVLRGSSLQDIAARYALDVETSDLFTQNDGFGEFTSFEFTSRVFSMGQGRVAEPLRVRQGYIVFRVDEIAAPHVPAFEAVADRVRADVVAERAAARAAQRAQEFAERLAAGADLATIASEASSVVDSTELLPRDGTVPVLGRSAELMQAAFQKNAGDVGGPVKIGERFVLFKVTEHRQPDWALFAGQEEELRQQEAATRRNRMFEAFVQSLRSRYPVRVQEDVLARLAG